MKPRKFKFIAVVVVTVLCAYGGLTMAGNVSRYLENTYDGTFCDPDSNATDDRNFTATTADWYNYMDAVGYNTATVTDSFFTKRAVTDPDNYSWGLDTNFIELRDIAIIAAHGNSVIPTWDTNRYYRFRQNERYPLLTGDCLTWPHLQMYLGEGSGDDIEILHMLSCHSMTVDNDSHINTWRPIFGGIHQVDGFHGTAYSNAAQLSDNWENLAINGFSNGVAYEWLDELFVNNYQNSGFDQCPVAYTGRNTALDAINLLVFEEYDTRDSFTDISSPTSFKRIWISGCEPYDADPLP